ncbi:MAG: T9SS type A sorting domain-containing protein [Bacteroidota bacterium]
MKKLIFTILFMSFGALSLVQAQGPASCPEITNFELVEMTGPAGVPAGTTIPHALPYTNYWRVVFSYRNVTSGAKAVKVVVTCSGNPIIITGQNNPPSGATTTDCFAVPNNSTTVVAWQSNIFQCDNLAGLVVFVESWVGGTSCGGNLCQRQISVGGSPLPVTFKAFAATRNHSNVSLKWETAFEQNNSGFAVERNAHGSWQQVAFVASQASGGNSDAPLSYSYNDPNNINGMTQYRIRQVDFDQKSKYSDIRAVRGEGQIGKTIVYPNPSVTGNVSVVFEDATVARDVSLSDMSGRVVKSWRGVTNNNIQIDNLTPGMYSLRIVVPETGTQSVEKIIVSKR